MGKVACTVHYPASGWPSRQPFVPRRDSSWLDWCHCWLPLQVHKLSERPGRAQFYFGIFAILPFFLVQSTRCHIFLQSLFSGYCFYTFYSVCLIYFLECAVLYIFIWNSWQGSRGTAQGAHRIALRQRTRSRTAATTTTFIDCKTATCFF